MRCPRTRGRAVHHNVLHKCNTCHGVNPTRTGPFVSPTTSGAPCDDIYLGRMGPLADHVVIFEENYARALCALFPDATEAPPCVDLTQQRIKDAFPTWARTALFGAYRLPGGLPHHVAAQFELVRHFCCVRRFHPDGSGVGRVRRHSAVGCHVCHRAAGNGFSAPRLVEVAGSGSRSDRGDNSASGGGDLWGGSTRRSRSNPRAVVSGVWGRCSCRIHRGLGVCVDYTKEVPSFRHRPAHSGCRNAAA